MGFKSVPRFEINSKEIKKKNWPTIKISQHTLIQSCFYITFQESAIHCLWLLSAIIDNLIPLIFSLTLFHIFFLFLFLFNLLYVTGFSICSSLIVFVNIFIYWCLKNSWPQCVGHTSNTWMSHVLQLTSCLDRVSAWIFRIHKCTAMSFRNLYDQSDASCSDSAKLFAW